MDFGKPQEFLIWPIPLKSIGTQTYCILEQVAELLFLGVSFAKLQFSNLARKMTQFVGYQTF